VLVASSVYLTITSIRESKNKIQKTTTQHEYELVVTIIPEIKTYINYEFGYRVDYYKLLYPREIVQQGVYLSFVKFEQSKYTDKKGFAVGVTNFSSEREEARIKLELEQSGEAEMIKKEEITVGGIKAIKLSFKPLDDDYSEPRAVAIFEKDQKSYSISSHPENFEGVIESFEFFK
jgi:hypothetical protein